MEQEVITSNTLIEQGWDIYEKFIDEMMEKSSLKSLWNFVKNVKNQYI